MNTPDTGCVRIAMSLPLYLCALTGLPLRTLDPFVALPVTGRAGRFAWDVDGGSCADWGPRMPPARGVMKAKSRASFDPGQKRELDLWDEGFRVDAAAPWRAGDWMFASGMRVWPLGAPSAVPAHRPTPRRVMRMLGDRGLPTGQATAPVRPFVFVEMTAPTRADACAWIRRVESLARDNAWTVPHTRVDGSTAHVHIGPQSLDVVMKARTLPYQRGEAVEPPRRSHPVGLCLVHRRAWERACEMGEVDHIACNVEHVALRDDLPPWSGPASARSAVSKAMGLIAAVDIDRAGWLTAEDIRALSAPAPGTLGLRWAVGRALQGAVPVRSTVRGIAEILAVDSVMRATGRRWAPSRTMEPGHDPQWEPVRAMADVTREIAQKLAEHEAAL